jgi:hypothetical protein
MQLQCTRLAIFLLFLVVFQLCISSVTEADSAFSAIPSSGYAAAACLLNAALLSHNLFQVSQELLS